MNNLIPQFSALYVAKNPHNLDLHLRYVYNPFSHIHHRLFILFNTNLSINSLGTSEEQIIATSSPPRTEMLSGLVIMPYVFRLELLDCQINVLIAESYMSLLGVNEFWHHKLNKPV